MQKITNSISTKLAKLADFVRSNIYIYIYIYRNARSAARRLKLSSRLSGLNLSRKISKLGVASAMSGFVLFVLVGSIFIPVYTGKHLAEATTGTATSSSLTLDMSSSSASVGLIVGDTSGTFSTSDTSGTNAAFTISTDNYTGHTVTIAATDDSQTLVNESDDTATLNSISSTIPNSSAASSFTNGTWGIKPNYYNSDTNTSYIPAPTTTATTLDVTTAANTSGKDYTIGLGVKADYTKPSGTYSNIFNMTATTNPVPYTINYVDNSGASVSGLPSPTSGDSIAGATSVPISTTVPTRANYNFVGWCSTQTTTSGTVCPGTIYYSGSSFGIDQTTENITTLYALWQAKPKLYDTVANMSKGDFDMSTINTSLTTDNSGVYKYTGSNSDDAINGQDAKDIYFYRGIIDSSFASSSRGSSGDGVLYPNYVKLSTTVGGTTTQTCWRIFRTTASGGVKMIYNGLWTGSTCANAQSNAQLSSTAYYNRAATYASASCSYSNAYCGTTGFITYAGYNYNSTYEYNNTSYTSVISNSTLFNNGTASNIRTQVENWYTQYIGTSNSGLFETNAGYCNDRTTYDSSNVVQTSTIPYATSSAEVRFGGYQRLYVNATPSLECPNTTGNDLLNGTTGKSYPVALITADEVALAGDGIRDKEAYSSSSFLTSGSNFWSLSPYSRYSNGHVYVSRVSSSGIIGSYDAYYAYGVRPVVSLTSDAIISTGSGTATMPWIVQSDLNLHNITYHSNDSSNKTALQGVISGENAVLAGKYLFTRDDYYIEGWDTDPNAVTPTYTINQTITPSDDMHLYAIWTPKYTITYNANGGSGTVASQQSDPTVILQDNSFTRTDYTFKGWDTDANATTPTYIAGQTITPTGDMTLYAIWEIYPLITFKTSNAAGIVFDGTTYTNSQTARIAPGTYKMTGAYNTRYTVSNWSATAGTIENASYQSPSYTVTGDATITLTGQYVSTAMQSLSSSSCTTTASPVYDTRDNEVYWVQAFADGNCWMLDNLRLDPTTVTLADLQGKTNSSNTTLGYLKNGGGSSPYNTTGVTAGGDFSDSYTYAKIYADDKDKVVESYGSGSGKVGVYYNFCAATAGSYCYSSAPSNTNASEDICPSGWHMPTGGSSGEYQALCTVINGGTACSSSQSGDTATNFRNALSTPLSGGYDSRAYYQGFNGRFWSSTNYGSYSMDGLSVGSSSVYPYNNSNGRSTGYSVRCVFNKYYTITFKTSNATGIVFNGTTYTNNQTAQIAAGNYTMYGTYDTRYTLSSWSATAGTISNTSYLVPTYTVTSDATITLNGQYVSTAMQSLSSSSCTTTASPVYDTRDNEVYWVQELADGKCWMLDNLRLDPTTVDLATLIAGTNSDNTTLTYLKNGSGSSPYTTAAVSSGDMTDSYTYAKIYADDKDKVVESYGSGSGKVGVYYNYCAATAGSYCYAENAGPSHASADNDICPTGWRMPTGGSSGEYQALCDKIKGSSCGTYWYEYSVPPNLPSALSTPSSGTYSSSASQGSGGNFWSSTRSGGSFMYYLSVSSPRVYPQQWNYRYFGFSVRCLLK